MGRIMIVVLEKKIMTYASLQFEMSYMLDLVSN